MKYKLITALAVLFLFAGMKSGISQIEKQITKPTTEVSKAIWVGETGPIRDITPVLKNSIEKRTKVKSNKVREVENFIGHVPRTDLNPDALPKDGDALAALPNATENMIPVEPILNFDGVDQSESGVLPPDTNGDVGPNHYFQTTNGSDGSVVKIFDKEGNLVYGPASSAIFWEGMGFQPFGDPVVLYDQFEERWLFTEFADFSANTMLMAYSETSDPTGNWNAYVVSAPSFPDYPKFGMWPDQIIITTNEPGDNAIPIYVIDKTAMINNEASADFVRLTDMTKFGGGGFQVAGAVDVDGFNLPAASTKPMVIRLYDDEWEGGQDQLEIWEIDVDFTNTGAATMTNIAQINTTPFESNLCDGNIYACVPQPSGTLVSALEQVMMHRTCYRNFGSYEAIVCNHSVDVTGENIAAIRWYELRRYPGGDWELFQEGTLGDGTDNRFMASVAMDSGGNMAIGYSITGPDKLLSLRYSGRRSSDLPGTLSVDEYEFVTGASENQNSRWGDYASMNVDPVDDRTFWFTGEYMGSGGDWKTRIVTFQLRRDTIDVGPSLVMSPESSAFLTNNETVTVEYKNFGLTTQGNFAVGYSLDGGAPVVEMVTDTIPSDSVYVHTFTPTVDLSALGDYQFKIWSGLATDANILNDTIRATVTQMTRWDTGVSNLEGLLETVCSEEVEIGIVVTNYGVEPLTSADISISFNGAAAVVIPWTGSLELGESATVNYLVTPLVQGSNTLSISTSNPNGVADQDMSNDALARSFEANLLGGGVNLLLTTDEYPGETSWELSDDFNNILYTGDGYSSTNLFTEEWCLGEGCFTFAIFDSWGDGICCGFGLGGYQIINADGIILAEGGEFGSFEAVEFCNPFECNISASATSSAVSAPGQNDGTIMVNVQNSFGDISYSLDGGTPQASATILNVSGGMHTITIIDGNGCETSVEIDVPVCALDATIAIMSPTDDATSDGTITVNAVNGNGTLLYSINGGATYQTSNVFNNVGAGFLTVVVKDDSDCLFFESIEVEAPVGIDELTLGQSVEIFPNPTDGVIQIEIKGLTDIYRLKFEVFDINGRRVHSGGLNKYNGVVKGPIALVAFPVGTYFLKFEHPDLKGMYKVVKQ